LTQGFKANPGLKFANAFSVIADRQLIDQLHANRQSTIDYHLAPCVPFFHITHSLGCFTQAVTPVDHWRYLSFLHERADSGQILLVRFRYKAHEQPRINANERESENEKEKKQTRESKE
jgi:hypothetical protein